MNPVIAREGRERFRGRKSAIFVTAWILGMSLIGYATYLIARLVAQDAFGLGRLVATGYMGRFMFQVNTLVVLTAVTLIIPGVAALAIVGERERQTLNLLQVTQLTPFQLIVGKLGASLSYLLWLVVVVLPVVGLPLLFGGATIGDIAAAIGMIFATAVLFGAASIWVSSRARSARAAVAGSYAIAIAIAFVSFAPLIAQLVFIGNNVDLTTDRPEILAAVPNPFIGMISAIEAPLEFQFDEFSFYPFTPVEFLLNLRQGAGDFFGGGAIEPGAVRIEDGRQFVNMTRPPMWLYNLIFDAGLTAFFLRSATRAVTAPVGQTFRLKRNRHAAP